MEWFLVVIMIACVFSAVCLKDIASLLKDIRAKSEETRDITRLLETRVNAISDTLTQMEIGTDIK